MNFAELSPEERLIAEQAVLNFTNVEQCGGYCGRRHRIRRSLNSWP